jgi:electron transfer flavoprotein beta subunit
MKCLIAVKQVVDPYVSIRINSNNTAVETSNIKMAMNPFDEIAMEEGMRQKEAGAISFITAVSIGSDKVQETLRQALARGADEAIHIVTNQTLSPLNIAKVLAILIKQQQIELVMLGKQAIDDDCNQTGQMLAAILGWAQGTFCSSVKFNTTNKTVTVARETDNGLETLELSLPVVITTDLRLNEPRYISLPNVMQAKRKSITSINLDSIITNIHTELETIKVIAPPQRKAGIMVQSVPELIEKLQHEAQVI